MCKNCINSVIVGASTRNVLAKKFKGYDVPTSLSRSAPEYCSVYVISKGKIMSAQAALRPAANTPTPPKQPHPQGLPLNVASGHSGVENGARCKERTIIFKFTEPWTNDLVSPPGWERPRSSTGSMSLENFDIPTCGQMSSLTRGSISDESDISGSSMFGSMDVTNQNLDFSIVQDPPRASLSTQSARELEAEMKRLKLELKQTIGHVQLSLQRSNLGQKSDKEMTGWQAKELHQWKLEEAHIFEEVRLAEETALAIAEMQKAKCKAAMEAQRLAEKEAQRRKHAEMKARREAEEKNWALNALAHNNIRYRKYTIEEIKAGTQNFSESMKVGEGGYGPVYKGKLDHTPVAIKVLRPDAAQGRKQFQQQIEVLSCIRHPNMVLLLGACPEYGCLVYEYMTHGSLEDRLFHKAKSPMGLAHQVKKAIEKDKFADFLHPTVSDWPVEEALLFAKLALECAELRKKDRPDLGTVILPELNRLRDLGSTTDLHNSHGYTTGNQSYSHGGHPPTPTRSSHSRPSNESQNGVGGIEHIFIPRKENSSS
ncbi:Protein kinase domain [Quillaja saponaria]|uniref:RING-type E3 ubiquitin transferase n=1 Tax=Quillaja saponaria TaxID=32244 RepID=A0AAD7LIA4_QUISA|nr:Protein kinase domain [Quillaja saponaria]